MCSRLNLHLRIFILAQSVLWDSGRCFCLGRTTSASRNGHRLRILFHSPNILFLESSSVVNNPICQIPLFPLPTGTARYFFFDYDDVVVFRHLVVFHLFHSVMRLLLTSFRSNAALAGLAGHAMRKESLLKLSNGRVETSVVVCHRSLCAGSGIGDVQKGKRIYDKFTASLGGVYPRFQLCLYL